MSCTPSRFWNRSSCKMFLAAILGLTALLIADASFLGYITSAAPSAPAPPQTPTALTEPKASAGALSAMARLRLSATSAVKSNVSRETGNYDFVRAVNGGVLVVDNTGDVPEARAFSFLREYGDLIGMSAAERKLAVGSSTGADAATSTLKTAGVANDSVGSSHIRLNQFYRGLPVFGAQVVVHVNSRGITGVSGHYVPGIKGDTAPRISDAIARTTALNQAGPSLIVVKSELSIYRKGLLEGYQGQSVLAYNIELTDRKATRLQVWVDAIKGGVLNTVALSHSALNRTIYTPEHDPLFAVRHEGDPLTPGPTPGTTGAEPINNLYVMAGHTYNMFMSGFGYDSYDGLGHAMDSVFLVNDVCPNAYWNGLSTNYCPDFDADDVVSHEWGHAYTQYTHGLIYSYQSGALNESYSDIVGESADLLNGVDAEGGSNNSQPRPAGQRWQIGEDVPTLSAQQLGILRDMWTPTNYGDPDKVTSGSYACGSGDGGGVHTNSGVPNHAYAMLVDGKTFNGQTVTGIGFNRALHIYFRAMTVYQTPSTNFPQHAEALRASCNDLIGLPLNAISTSSATGTPSGEVITATTCQQVDKAILAVEMDLPVPCNLSPILDPDTPVSCDGATTIFAEDWESGDDGWTRTSTGVFADWEDGTRNLRDFKIDSTLPQDRAGSAAYAANIALGEPGGGTCAPGGDYSGQYTIDSPNIALPANAEVTRLSFDHYVATEATFDGGQLEVSVNGGAFQLVPQASYIHNAPNAPFEAAPPVGLNTNPNAGEQAWHGTNVGSQTGSWGTTIVDLADLTNPGDQVKLRFTYSQDGCNGVDGWYVDNIKLYFCPPLEAPTLSLGSNYENPDSDGSYTLNWVRPAGASGPDVLQQSTTCAPLISDDAESGLAQWTAASSELVAPMWTTSSAKPNHSSTTFWANPVSEQETQNTNATLTFKAPIQIPGSGITTLNFSEWFFNESDDHGFVEVSQDNGATWTPIYDNNRNGDIPTGTLALAEEDLKAKQVDLTIYSGQTIKLRFRFALGQSNFLQNLQFGWYIDDISIVNDSFTDVTTTAGISHTLSGVSNGTRCYRVRTTYTFGAQQVRGPYSNIVSATVSRSLTPPSVSITSPTEGATYPGGSNITVIATADDTDGTVAKVEFFEGGNKLGEDTTGPDYRVTWNSVAPGSYTLTAKATDNDGATTTSSPIHITVNEAPASECMEDDDPRIAYSNGWHLGNDGNASAGHFRYNTGKDSQHGVALVFEVPAGRTGKIDYYFARSTKKGTADVYLDGVYRQTVNYQGSAGSMQHPEFSPAYVVSYGGLNSGSHTLELRNVRDVVFIDRFCLESASSNAQPTAGPGATTNQNQNLAGGKSSSTNYPMQPGAREISLVAESNLGVPFQLVLIDPTGVAVQTVNSSSGLATINSPVGRSGIYVMKVVNLSLGPVQVMTAATPLVNR